jgi:hypothetical protein
MRMSPGGRGREEEGVVRQPTRLDRLLLLLLPVHVCFEPHLVSSVLPHLGV